MTNNERQYLFERWAASYDVGVTNQDDFPFAGYEQVLTLVTAEAGLDQGMTVLELGSGTGNLSERIRAKTPCIVGVDFAQSMLAQARAKVPDGIFLPLDLTSDDWSVLQPYRFTRVMSAYVLHEFPLARVVEIVLRLRATLLEAQSSIVFGDIAFPKVELRQQASEYWHDSWDDDEYYFAADEAMRAFTDVGFQVRYQQVSACAGVFVLE